MMQLRAEHLSGAAGGALDVLKGALSGAASSLTLPHLSVRVRASLLSAHHTGKPRTRLNARITAMEAEATMVRSVFVRAIRHLDDSTLGRLSKAVIVTWRRRISCVGCCAGWGQHCQSNG